MCGIAGVAGGGFRPGEQREIIESMCDAIFHRGPDEGGAVIGFGRFALGMRRLSIIDLAGGHQPMSNEDDSVWVVFNGEIYNHHELRVELRECGHVFKTRSDTEVLVHGFEEYGPAVVDHLRGMFCFAIWDDKRESLFVARDRFGIKPLYYTEIAGRFWFGSELRTLLASGHVEATVDAGAVENYLSYGYVPDPASIIRGVQKVPPGFFLEWSPSSNAQLTRYWDPRSFHTEAGWDEAVRHTRLLLEDAVASRMESEVPLGAFLSGGVDSSTVVAMMAAASDQPVRTFSIGFGEKEFNEAPYAKAMARRLGTKHEELIVSPDIDGALESVIEMFDEPFGDPSAIPTSLMCSMARSHVTVALSGDGGDEIFGGYERYWDTLSRPQVPSLLRPALRRLGSVLPHGLRGRNRLIDIGRSRSGQYANAVLFPLRTSEGGVTRPVSGRQPAALEEALNPHFQGLEGRDWITRMTLVDVDTYLPGDILTKVDRTSMAVSLEVRVPLLDHHLAEYVLGLPGDYKVRGDQGKFIMKAAIADIIPEEILERPKQGFDLPLVSWFRGPLRHRVERVRSAARTAEFVSSSAVGRICSEHDRGRRDHARMIWRLLVLECWLEALDRGIYARGHRSPGSPWQVHEFERRGDLRT